LTSTSHGGKEAVGFIDYNGALKVSSGLLGIRSARLMSL
jgi:hypothetical protein